MTSVAPTNRQMLLRDRPSGAIRADLWQLAAAPTPEPGDGQFLVRNLFLSIDPAMRGWIAAAANYAKPVALGAVMRSFAVGQVAASRDPRFRPGEYLFGRFGWQDYCLCDGGEVDRRVDPEAAPLTTALGVLGLNGATGYLGLMLVGQPQAGNTVLVSTAAGAVGSVVGQAARILGCRTVGLTGSDAKAAQCRDLFGFDAAINYRAEPDLAGAIGRACPDGIDVFFDNVGGTVADAAMSHLAERARIVVCGTIGIPSDPPPSGPRYNRILLVKRARMEGFLVLDHLDRLDEVVETLAPWVRDGRMRYQEDIVDGLEKAPAALMRVLAGENGGKQIVRL
ncbi:MAG: NADP-dependent oxidoreductase [Alphaproteobacteria bacterium]